MSQLHSVRSEQALETGRAIITSVIREPVREAVREALAEERERDPRPVAPSGSDGTDGGSHRLAPAVLALVGLTALWLYLRRRDREQSPFATAGDDATESDGRSATAERAMGTHDEGAAAREGSPD